MGRLTTGHIRYHIPAAVTTETHTSSSEIFWGQIDMTIESETKLLYDHRKCNSSLKDQGKNSDVENSGEIMTPRLPPNKKRISKTSVYHMSNQNDTWCVVSKYCLQQVVVA